MHILRALIITLILSTPAMAEKRIAFVIGNNDYKNVEPLRKAVNDARSMSSTLRKIGFEVVSGENLTRSQTNFKLQQFLNQIKPGDTTMVFYAGHGIEVKGLNYLLPVDIPKAKPGYESYVTSEAISVDNLLAELRERKARVTILVLDACRDNPFALQGGRSLGAKRGLARLRAPEGTFIMYSAGTGESALDRLGDADANPNSVYTRTLIPLLETPGIDLRSVAKKARSQVKKIAATVGHRQTPAYYDEFVGDFSFVEANSQSTPNTGGSPTMSAGSEGGNISSRAEVTFWDSIKTSTNPEAYKIYLAKFPKGIFADLARLKLKELEEKEKVEEQKKVAAATSDAADSVHKPRPRSYREQCKSRTSGPGVDLYCVSSVLPPQKGNFYGVESLLDGNNKTAWIEGLQGQGIGEWITVEFDGLRLVKQLQLKNGYSKTRNVYRRNSRVRYVELRFSGGERKVIELVDDPDFRVYKIDRPIKARWVQIIIKSVVAGSRFSDTAINELRVVSSPAGKT